MGSLSERLLKFSFVVKNGYNKNPEIHSAPVSVIRKWKIRNTFRCEIISNTVINLNDECIILIKKLSLSMKA